ncbi:MAG: HD domain-containing protein [bacterium]
MKTEETMVKEYLNILCNDYPKWLDDYIQTSEMQRINEISIGCGTDYSGMYDIPYFYSNLTHSIGVALVIWNFTKDKKATLSGLFHDIATPVFKHCIDFMNGDSENQESTEERTYDIIKNSMEIRKLLDRDKINLEDVVDYKMYSIADNDTPKLSADRLEYTFSSGMTLKKVWDLEKIKKIYENIIVETNEFNELELMFKDKEIAEEYIDIISTLWPSWVDDNDRTVMQFIADIVREMIEKKYITLDDLYILSEREVIQKIKNCDDKEIREAFNTFEKLESAQSCDGKVANKYSVYTKSKTRYINPYVHNQGRVSTISKRSNQKIEEYLNLRKEGWTSLDLNFKLTK